jgi:hypothetical protein
MRFIFLQVYKYTLLVNCNLRLAPCLRAGVFHPIYSSCLSQSCKRNDGGVTSRPIASEALDFDTGVFNTLQKFFLYREFSILITVGIYPNIYAHQEAIRL